MEANQQSQNQTQKTTRRRVKVYHLGEKGEWDDKGTGHVTCTYVEKFGDMGLIVRSEKNDDQILLETRVHRQDIYQIQQDTLVVWTDPDTDTELALSFQEVAGCKEIWEQIATIQKLTSTSDSDDDAISLNNTMYVEDEPRLSDDPGFEIPPPTLNNLPKIVEVFTIPMLPTKRDRLASAIARENYLSKLFELFHMCEDLDDEDNLHSIFHIFKSIVLMNDPGILEQLLSEEMIFDLMGTLEYDPELPTKQSHREYLKTNAVFREVVPFENPALVAKIHTTFRIQYLKDVVLPRLLDDPTFTTLNSLIFFNNVEIVGQIQSDSKFLSEIFRRLKLTDLAPDQFRDLIMFLQELCNLAKGLQNQSRMIFYQNLSKYGFLDILERALLSKEVPVRLSIVNIIDSVLTHDPSLLRNYILSQKPSYPFFSAIISTFINDSEMGIRVQLVEILRILIDTTNMEESPEKDAFLTMFYSDFIEKIVEPLSEPIKGTYGELSLVKESICDILSFCLQHHTYRIKYFVLGKNVINKALKLVSIKDKPLTLAVVRLFRAFVGMKDDFYFRHIIKYNLFKPIVEVFEENGPRYNLLNSAVIELFEFIRKENLRSLIQHLVENYGSVFKDIDYVQTFKLLLVRHDQNTELNNSNSSGTLSSDSTKESQKEDEDYFKEEDDDDKPANGEDKEGQPLVDLPNDFEKPSVPPFLDRKMISRNGNNDEDTLGVSPRPLRQNKPKISFNLKSASFLPRERLEHDDPEMNDSESKRRKV